MKFADCRIFANRWVRVCNTVERRTTKATKHTKKRKIFVFFEAFVVQNLVFAREPFSCIANFYGGKIKTCTISHPATGKWFSCLALECDAQLLPKSKESIGIDVDLKAFAVLSNGEAIANPKFFRQAENAGRDVVQVNPRNTSQICSGCGALVEKDLRVRIHDCPNCGLVLDRDHNSAITILALGLQSLPQMRIEAVLLLGVD